MNSEEIIKDLCIRAIKAEGDDFPLAAELLHAALRAHIGSVRVMAAIAFQKLPGPPSDRDKPKPLDEPSIAKRLQN